MLHPSYSDLMKIVNSEVEPGEAPVVNSRYSIVMATSKRARQIIGGEDALVNGMGKKPLSIAVEELNQGKIKILSEEEIQELEEKIALEGLLDESDETEDEEIDEAEDEAEDEEIDAETYEEADMDVEEAEEDMLVEAAEEI